MANDGISKRDDGTWEMDTAAFIPDPQGYIKIRGVEYPIFSFLDIPVEDSMRVVKLSEEIEAAKDFDARMARSIEHLIALNAGPDSGRGNRKLITAETLKGITPRQVIGLVVMASTIASIPPKADESESERLTASASSVPASAASTVGTPA